MTCVGIARQLQVLVPGLLEPDLMAAVYRAIATGAACDGAVFEAAPADLAPAPGGSDEGAAAGQAAPAQGTAKEMGRFTHAATLLAPAGCVRVASGAADSGTRYALERSLLAVGLKRLGMPMVGMPEDEAGAPGSAAAGAAPASAKLPSTVPREPDYEDVLWGVSTCPGCRVDLLDTEVPLSAFLSMSLVPCVSHGTAVQAAERASIGLAAAKAAAKAAQD